MSKENKTDQATVEAVKTSEDLSDAIEAWVEKKPGEEVRSVRVYGDHYRCNWWVIDKTVGPIYLNGGRIIRSKFLRATKDGDNLIVEDVSPQTRALRDAASAIAKDKE